MTISDDVVEQCQQTLASIDNALKCGVAPRRVLHRLFKRSARTEALAAGILGYLINRLVGRFDRKGRPRPWGVRHRMCRRLLN